MDPLSALGLASNIVSFIDFASKLVRGAARVYESASGLPSDLEDVAVITESLESYMNRLSTSNFIPPTSVNGKAFISLVNNCRKTCDELQRMVAKIGGKASPSRTDSVRVAWRAMRQKENLKELKERLDRFSIQIWSHLNLTASEQLNDMHSWVKSQTVPHNERTDEFEQIRREVLQIIRSGMQQTQTSVVQDQLNEHGADLREIRDVLSRLTTTVRCISAESRLLEALWFPELESRSESIRDAHKGTYRWLLHGTDADSLEGSDDRSAISSTSNETTDSSERASNDGTYNDGVSNDGVSNDGASNEETASHENLFRLEAIAVDSELVQDSVPEPTDQTDDSGSESADSDRASMITNKTLKMEEVERQIWRERFINWLQDENGLFYISGKPGSGKSTLMKNVGQDPSTHEALQTWAEKNGKRLLLVQFYFWSSGTPLQKSIEGLYRSILWQILRRRPDLMGQLCPDLLRQAYEGEARAISINLLTLENAFRRLISSEELLKEHKVCFFIDGLDEYEGDYWKLAKFLKSWCSAADVKLCVSSRPYNEFAKVFAPDDGKWLKLHELTKGDILRVIQDEFAGDERFVEARQHSEEYEDLFTTIVEKADGVFVWVLLVIRSLLNGIGNDCSLAQLRKRLSVVPIELSSMFRHMMADIDISDQQAAARVFLTMKKDVEEYKPSSWVFLQSVLDDLVDDAEYEKRLLDGKLGRFLTPEECTSKCAQVGRRLVGRCCGLVQVIHTGQDFPLCHRIQFVHRTVSDFLGEDETMNQMKAIIGNYHPRRALALGLLAIVKQVPHFPRIKCQGSNERKQVFQLTKNNAEGRAFSWYNPYFQLHPLLELAAATELDGLRPLSAESRAMEQMLIQYATLTDYHVITTALQGGPVYWQWFTTTPENYEITMSCIAALYGARELVREQIRNRGFDAKHGSLLLLASSISELQWTRFEHSATEETLEMTRFLLHRKASPNYELRSVCHFGIRCYFPKDVMVEPYASSPAWTAWTLYLLRLSQRMIYMLDDPGPEWKERLQLYLDYGADTSVCFIGYKLPDREDDSPRATYGFSGETSQSKDIDIHKNLRGPCYADLSTMLDIWGLDVKVPQENWVTKAISTIKFRPDNWFSALGQEWPSNFQKISSGVKRQDFMILKVAPFSKLQNVGKSDLDRGLRHMQERMEQNLIYHLMEMKLTITI